MEMAFILSSILLISYSALALFDGVYLHLFKYRLHEQESSKFEHLIHSIRALLFSGILYTLYIGIENNRLFLIGLVLVLIDVITLIIDAYVEKNSREFMGGLPRWEYILHLLVNGFHFASIAVFLVIKVELTHDGAILHDDFQNFKNYSLFQMIAVNLLPGAVLIALLHIVVCNAKFNLLFKKLRFNCC